MVLTKKPSSAAFLPRRWDCNSRWHSIWWLLEIRRTRNWLLFHPCGMLVEKGAVSEIFARSFVFEADSRVATFLHVEKQKRR